MLMQINELQISILYHIVIVYLNILYFAFKFSYYLNCRTVDQREAMGRDFVDCMAAAGCSRTVATVLCYPHGKYAEFSGLKSY